LSGTLKYALKEKNMFEDLEMAPPDAILGLKEAFKLDPNPDKINLSVGVYKDADGTTPVLESVRRAEAALLEEQASKEYLSITGSPELGCCVQKLLFGEDHEIISSNRAATAQTPGGTGALRVAGDFIKKVLPGSKIWLSDPTWANHRNVFRAAGLEICSYPYYDSQRKTIGFDNMMNALAEVPARDIVLFHACCHNPTGADPTPGQWQQLAVLAGEKGFLPLFDFAYQGFGDGLDEDAAGLRTFAVPGCKLLVTNSFSKNMSLYNERVGSLTVVDATAEAAAKAFSHISTCIRANYSNPPAHGGKVVTKVLSDPELHALWLEEVAAMRGRLNTMRALFVKTLAAKGVKQDFSFMANQRGMFSFTGLTPDQVNRLRDQYAIYIVGSGRINVAGITEKNIDRLCQAIADVLAA